jgi:phosphatidylserine/phosphatidylglycerophosphate/cardiolipin synthase-like enzyme
MKLLMNGTDFWPAVERDIAEAREAVEMQTLSLADDAVGWQLAAALMTSRARRKRIIVDRLSSQMRQLRAAGVQVRFNHPVGALMRRMPAHSHKKTITIDGHISYFGGSNFSDPWHHLMVRAENERIAGALAGDFEASWRGRERGCYVRADGLELHTLAGNSNHHAIDMLFTRLHLARTEILVSDACLTPALRDHLGRVTRHGVRITVVRPCESHLKVILIDDSCLVFGTAHFDYHAHQAVLAYITDAAAITQFRTRVLEADLVSFS